MSVVKKCGCFGPAVYNFIVNHRVEAQNVAQNFCFCFLGDTAMDACCEGKVKQPWILGKKAQHVAMDFVKEKYSM